jgi:hypothetical protein
MSPEAPQPNETKKGNGEPPERPPMVEPVEREERTPEPAEQRHAPAQRAPREVMLTLNWPPALLEPKSNLEWVIQAIIAAAAVIALLISGIGLIYTRRAIEQNQQIAKDTIAASERVANQSITAQQALASEQARTDNANRVDDINRQNEALTIYGLERGDKDTTVVHPGMTNVGTTLQTPKPLTQPMIDALKTTARLYVFGEVVYRDVFRRTHTTTWCQYVNDDLTMRWCDTYNYAD